MPRPHSERATGPIRSRSGAPKPAPGVRRSGWMGLSESVVFPAHAWGPQPVSAVPGPLQNSICIGWVSGRLQLLGRGEGGIPSCVAGVAVIGCTLPPSLSWPRVPGFLLPSTVFPPSTPWLHPVLSESQPVAPESQEPLSPTLCSPSGRWRTGSQLKLNPKRDICDLRGSRKT